MQDRNPGPRPYGIAKACSCQMPLVPALLLTLSLLSAALALSPATGITQHEAKGLHAPSASVWEEEDSLRELLARLDPREVSQCEKFLLRTMPKEDIAHITRHRLRVNSILALTARYANPWSHAVPWRVFLNDVLPYASLDEPRDAWRGIFTQLLAPLVANATSLTDAAQRLNRDLWGLWGIVFKSEQTPAIMSPSQVIAAGYASCTGLSIFLVDACRAVGIPARVAGTPSWNQMRRAASEVIMDRDLRLVGGSEPSALRYSNNHNWVEVWDDNRWSFLGAAEYDPAGPNRTWFFPQPVQSQTPGSRLHAVYAASWERACGDTTFPLAWNKHARIPACDVTQSYLDTPVP